MKHSPQWFRFLERDEDKEDLQKRIIAAKPVLEVLHRLIEEKGYLAHTASLDKTRYELSAWSEYQADSIGYQRACTEIMRLLEERD